MKSHRPKQKKANYYRNLYKISMKLYLYLWMSETLQLFNRIPQNLGNGLFSFGFVKLFGASFLKYKY